MCVKNPLRLGRICILMCARVVQRDGNCDLLRVYDIIRVMAVLLQVNAVRTSFHCSVRPWLVPSSFRLSGSISRTVGNKQASPIVKSFLSFPSTPFEDSRSVLRKLLGGVGNLITQGRYTKVCTFVCSRCRWVIRVILRRKQFFIDFNNTVVFYCNEFFGRVLVDYRFKQAAVFQTCVLFKIMVLGQVLGVVWIAKLIRNNLFDCHRISLRV